MLTHVLETRDPETIRELVLLALAQEARQHVLMPGLLATHTSEQIEAQLRDAPLLLVATNAAGHLRGAAAPTVWRIKRESILRAFLAGCNGVTQSLLLPDPQEADMSDVLGALLHALTTFWHQQETAADLLRWPSLETGMLPLISAYGFQVDSVCAVRTLEPFFATTPRVPRGLHVRLANASDADAIVRLFHEELLFHTRFTPFVRSSPTVLQAFERTLARLWQGETVADGTPLILVVAQGENLVAMAENTLITIEAHDEPGFTPPGRYWCIDNVSVRETSHHQGIGHILVQAIENLRLSLSLDVKGYLLWYNPDNTTAEHFWSHRGFTPLWTTYQHRKSWEEV